MNENIDDYNSSEELVHEFIDIVSRGGNLLLNVGPTADGRIPVIMQQRLVDIGEWLKVNGDAIYGTRSWEGSRPNQEKKEFVYFTKKGNDLFVICTQWPQQEFKIKGIKGTERTEVSFLGYDTKVNWKISEEGMIIQPPALSPATIPCSYAWVFKIENVVALDSAKR